ncbi:hypothetical protein BV22DRAFT_1133585 [Leucogyrophana mollusca]|uniref:Uncharacterized protein n=1 Tax=Leucogyrophana mollusca TaxID=85980 RepID=A0ACB8B302_9AGAM|nr:hypothetical protein BV22DRAFT_1133585 [Leucogyrophana mollusca]
MYKQKIIAKIIITQWFTNLQADGIRYAEYFTPFPLNTIAFVCTAIECAIDEWSTGERKQVDFNGKKYEKVYNRHMKNLNGWKKFSVSAGVNLAQQVLDELLNTARQRAGASAHTVEVDEAEELDYEDFMVNQGL